VKQCLGDDKYYQFIHATFTNSKSGSTHYSYHESLCRLLNQGKLKAILTTNFDPAFQHALAKVLHQWSDPVYIGNAVEVADLYEYMWSWDSQSPLKRILHLHGISKQRSSIILADSEYRDKYGFPIQPAGHSFRENLVNANLSADEINTRIAAYDKPHTLHRSLLWALFSTRRLIFMGTGLNDPYFTRMLEFVRDDLHSFNYARHYLVLRIADINEKLKAMDYALTLKKQFGIETVFFEENEGLTGLANFITELEETVLAPKEETPSLEQPEKIIIDDGDEDLTKHLKKIAKQDD
jgi:NAD-dependent SIR2 family protein deacetylase